MGNRRFSAVCIGGSVHGERHVVESSVFKVVVRQDLVELDFSNPLYASDNVQYEIDTYRIVGFFGTDYLVHESIDPEGVVDYLLKRSLKVPDPR